MQSPTLPLYPDLGIVIVTRNKPRFINSCFLPSTIRYPICPKEDVIDYMKTSIVKIKTITFDLETLSKFIKVSKLSSFEDEIHHFIHNTKLHESYFNKLLATNKATKFDATDSHNFVLRSTFQLEKLLDRIAYYILDNVKNKKCFGESVFV